MKKKKAKSYHPAKSYFSTPYKLPFNQSLANRPDLLPFSSSLPGSLFPSISSKLQQSTSSFIVLFFFSSSLFSSFPVEVKGRHSRAHGESKKFQAPIFFYSKLQLFFLLLIWSTEGTSVHPWITNEKKKKGRKNLRLVGGPAWHGPRPSCAVSKAVPSPPPKGIRAGTSQGTLCASIPRTTMLRCLRCD